METWLAGELMTVLGKWEGLTMRGPSMRPERSNCEMLCRLPKVVPTAMPISRVVASLISSLLSSMASLAAEQTSLVLRSRSCRNVQLQAVQAVVEWLDSILNGNMESLEFVIDPDGLA